MDPFDISCQSIYESLNIKKDVSKVIFVYSLPKVGSTSLITTLRIFGSSMFNLIHIHDENMLNHIFGINNITIIDFIQYCSSQEHEVLVIDIYREPIERKISDFFEKISLHFNTSEDNMYKYPLSTLIERFNNIFPQIPNFDPLRNRYNLDLPLHFNHDQGFDLFKRNNVSFLSLRLRDSHNWGTILSTNLGINIKMVKDYETSSKKINLIYQSFKNEFKIPINYLEDLKNNSDLLYYLSKDELNNYLDLWQTKTSLQHIGYSPEQYEFYIKLSSSNNLEDKIKPFHYKDEGCICLACSKQRNFIQKLILSNRYNGEKIHHHICVDIFKRYQQNLIRRLPNTLSTGRTRNLSKMQIFG